MVLADFTNTTGDAVFDGALRQALAIQLEQSPFLKIMDDREVRSGLRFMGRSPDERVTSALAREICERAGDKATISGSVSNLGKAYVIALEATNCHTGETLAREQAESPDKEHVLKALATAATSVRGKLGESLASIQKLNYFFDQATTSSLEAFQSYAVGEAQKSQGVWLAAIPHYRRAVELDPNFAIAYARMAVMYSNAGERERGIEYTKKAFGLIDRVTEHEKLYIASQYYNVVLRDLDKTIEAYQAYARTYPRDLTPHVNLGIAYWAAGQADKAAEQHLEAIRLEPKVAVSYGDLIADYNSLDKYDEAKAIAEKAFSLKLDSPAIHSTLLRAAYAHGDQPVMQREIQWAKGTDAEYQSLTEQARYADYLGQRKAAKELRMRAVEMATRKGLRAAAAGYLAGDSASSAWAGDCQTATSQAHAAAALVDPGTLPPLASAALALATCGDVAGAQKIADEISRQSPTDTLWNARDLPGIRAAIELKPGQPGKAIDLLKSAVPYERASANVPYLRGIAYLQLNQGTEAAAEFQKILDHKGQFLGMTYALSYVGLAKSAVLMGASATARKAYEDFLALWKDADPTLPVLVDARKEYAVLK